MGECAGVPVVHERSVDEQGTISFIDLEPSHTGNWMHLNQTWLSSRPFVHASDRYIILIQDRMSTVLGLSIH